MNDELLRIWRDVFMVYFRVLLQHSTGDWGKIQTLWVTVASNMAKISTQYIFKVQVDSITTTSTCL